MWIVYAVGSAFFAGITSILAKCGIKKTDSNVATAIRTVIVLIFSWLIVFITDSVRTISDIPLKTWVFLILSGLATGASWLCYFHALQIGDINKVVPIDKSSTVLSIILAVIILHEKISCVRIVAVVLIAVGTYLMIQKKESSENKDTKNKSWILYAFGSAIFASLTAILGKIGITGIESNLGTAIRTFVVLVMAWIMVAVTGKMGTVKSIPRKEMLLICLSGIATETSWLCYYKALQDGLACVVVPIDKLSILVTIVFSYVVFKEKLTTKAGIGLVLIVAGTLAMLL